MKGWDSNANKQNRGNQHRRTSELLLYIQILFFFFFFFFFFFYVFSLSLFQKHGVGIQTSFNTMAFGGGKTQIDPTSKQHALNPAIAAPHLLRLSAMRARLTSPRRLILACELKNTRKNATKIADV
jgi:hypothetical protein